MSDGNSNPDWLYQKGLLIKGEMMSQKSKVTGGEELLEY